MRLIILLFIVNFNAWATEAISVELLINGKQEFINTPTKVSGVVDDYYLCPVCPQDDECKACSPDFLILRDGSKKDLKIVVHLITPPENHRSLKKDSPYSLWVTYLTKKRLGLGNEHGLFENRQVISK